MSIHGIGTAHTASNQHDAMFRRLDRNHDGQLDRRELQRLAADISQKTGQTVSADQLLQQFDQDGDGKLSKSEMPPPPRPPRQAGYGDTSSYERRTGGAGAGGVPSLESMAQSLSQATGRPVDREGVLALLDSNGDRQISKDEADAGRQALVSDLRERLDAMRLRA